MIWLENKNGDFVVDPIDVSRTSFFCNLKMIHCLIASEAIDTLTAIIRNLKPIDFRARLDDAKRHARIALNKDTCVSDRVAILIESLDVLLGWEEFYVPSSQNTIKQIKLLIKIFQEHPDALICVR